MLTSFALKCFLRKKAVSEYQFREYDVSRECSPWKTMREIHVSSNNLVHNAFAEVSTI